jgi:predicted ATP-dependent serine protease
MNATHKTQFFTPQHIWNIREQKREHLLTGFNSLDNIEQIVKTNDNKTQLLTTGLIGTSDLIVISGETGSGKSLLALNMGLNIAKNGGRVLYLNNEISDKQAVNRIDMLGFNWNEDFGRLDTDGRHRFIYRTVLSTEVVTVQTITDWALNYGALPVPHPINVIFIDLLDMITQSIRPIAGVNMWREISNIMIKLSELAKKQNWTIFVICQLKKNHDQNVVATSRVAGSAEVTNKADKVCEIERYQISYPAKFKALSKEDQNALMNFSTIRWTKDRDGLISINSQKVIVLSKNFGFKELSYAEEAMYYDIINPKITQSNFSTKRFK